MFLNHLSDHNVANINIYDVAVSDIVHISTELRITAANHKNSVCTLDVLVQKTTELGVLSVPITRYTRVGGTRRTYNKIYQELVVLSVPITRYTTELGVLSIPITRYTTELRVLAVPITRYTKSWGYSPYL